LSSYLTEGVGDGLRAAGLNECFDSLDVGGHVLCNLLLPLGGVPAEGDDDV
jgi:hypothetical protein